MLVPQVRCQVPGYLRSQISVEVVRGVVVVDDRVSMQGKSTHCVGTGYRPRSDTLCGHRIHSLSLCGHRIQAQKKMLALGGSMSQKFG